jgi:transcriptional regulator with XRE-family HTH domain
VTVLDHNALDRARKAAGLLPSQLARALQRSPDAVSALSKPRTEDRDLTLADLRALANALGVSPQQLLTDYVPGPPTCELAALLVGRPELFDRKPHGQAAISRRRSALMRRWLRCGPLR